MPVVEDNVVSDLLTDGTLGSITVDTNIFDEKGLQLRSPALQAISGLKDKPFPFILSGTVANEVKAHLKKDTEDAIRIAKREIGKALLAFETTDPTRDALLAQITGGRSADVAAQERFDTFLKRSNCRVIDDTELVDTSTLFTGYFEGNPPFGAGKKKNEFPDALALNALEATAGNEDSCILVVSKDKDWIAFCEASMRLYLVQDIERALALINNANAVLRTAVTSWFGEGENGRGEVYGNIEHNVGQISFSASGHSSSGAMEAIAWSGELKDVTWPHDDDIDIIDITPTGNDNELEVVISLPLTLSLRIPVELSFEVWDSIDRESLNMGGREIDVDEELEARATITLFVSNVGTDGEDVYFTESELDIKYKDIDLGEVDMFPPEDYWDDEEPQ